MKMMDYQQCVAYVMENKLKTWHERSEGYWTVSGFSNGLTRSLDAPDYCAAVNTWMANFDAPDTQDDD